MQVHAGQALNRRYYALHTLMQHMLGLASSLADIQAAHFLSSIPAGCNATLQAPWMALP
jgi:hypothetical protein